MKKVNTNYQKAIERMEKETARAIAAVERLSRLHAKTAKKQRTAKMAAGPRKLP